MSVRSGQFQITGDEKKSSTRPVSSPSANPRGGQFQTVGDSLNMSRTSVQSPSANPSSGQFQITGDQASMSRRPIKGWGSAANLPMSERSIKQSQTAAGGGKGRKR